MAKIQLALDTTDRETAVAVLRQVHDLIDIVEAGTVFCLSAGLSSIAELAVVAPGKPIVADIRIGRAGKLFTNLAISNGADIITVLAEAPLTVRADAISAAHQAGKRLEVELAHGTPREEIQVIVDQKPDGVIVHQASNADFRDDIWVREALSFLSETKTNFEITLAGNLTADMLPFLESEWSIDTLVFGSEIVKAADPRAAVLEILAALKTPEAVS